MSFLDDSMSTYPPCIAASKKLKDIPANFRFYNFEWLGDKPGEWNIMKITGSEFREAKSGARKGKLVIKIPNTSRTVYVTKDEMMEASNGASD